MPVFARPSGSLALDLANTLDWRDDADRRVELLTSARAFSAWARHAGFPPAVSRGIRDERQRRNALRLRETLAALFRAVANGETPPRAAMTELTRRTRNAWRHRELVQRQGTFTWRWRPDTDAGDRLLFEISLEAAALLLSPDRQRVRICEGEGCGWMFVDRSKAGRRRWCSMDSCGNRVKVRKYRTGVSYE